MAASIKINGLDAAIEGLSEAERRLLDLRPVFEVAGEDLKTLVDDSFEFSRSPAGASWKPLAPATVRRRRQGSSKPLIDTGVLRNSINYRAGPQTLSLGTNVPYAGPHQFGTATIPARPFLPVVASGSGFAFVDTGPAAEELERIKQMIVTYITTGRVE